MSTDARRLNARHANGTLETRDGTHLLRFERHLTHAVEHVWAALTEPAQLVGWLADADVEFVIGGRVVLRWLNTDEHGNSSIMHGTITRLEPPRLLEYAGDIHGTLRWELRDDAHGGCFLTFTSTLLAPNDDLVESLAGWHVHLDHLGNALNGNPVNWPTWAPDHMKHWTELRTRYAAGLV